MECSWEKVMKGKKSQYDPYPSRSSVGPGGQRNQDMGVIVLFCQPLHFTVGLLKKEELKDI